MSACTVKYLDVLSHEFVRYDVQTSAEAAKRGREDIYRLGLLMEALVHRHAEAHLVGGAVRRAASHRIARAAEFK